MKHKKTFAAFLIILALMIVAAVTHTIWLEAIAKFLVVENDELTSADVIVILGGGGPERVEHAVKLYQSGYAKWIISTGMRRELPGITATWPQLAMRHAISMGVPETAFIPEERSTSTYEDAQYVKEDMLERGFHSAIIVSSEFHTRRARMAFRKVFKDQEDISMQFSPAEDDSFQISKWWTRERDLINVVNEYCKLVFYFFKYTI